MPAGIILKGIGGFYYVESEGTIYECKARGVFRKDEITPLPGDRVTLSIIDTEKLLGSIDEILPRESQLIRPAVANINQVVVVIAAKSPSPDMLLLDKLLITTEIKKLKAIVCINKIDLDQPGEYQGLIDLYTRAGYTAIPISSVTNVGFSKLRECLEGKISVFAGQSGVGKSTILNNVMNSLVMKTGNISEKIERGKHTTRHAELLKLNDCGYVVDTPGFSSFELSGIDLEELQLFFPEFSNFLNQCRFTGCSHINEPDCAIKEALQEDKIARSRYDRYTEFYKVLKEEKDNVYRNKGKVKAKRTKK